MSRFYYSGSLEQVNYLSRRDQLLRYLYGKWQTMFIEGLLFTLYGIGIVCLELIYNFTDLINIELQETFVIYGFSAIAFIMSIIFLITGFVIRKEDYKSILKPRAVIDLIIGLWLLIFPWSLYGILGTVSVFYGLNQLVGRKNQKSGFKKFTGILVLALGIGLLFLSSFNQMYANLILAVYAIGMGIYILNQAVHFRKSVKKFDDEEKGFTDYTIE